MTHQILFEVYVNVSSSSSLDDTLSLNFFLEIYLLWNDGTPTYTEINFEEKYDETFFDWANCIVGSRKRKEPYFSIKRKE